MKQTKYITRAAICLCVLSFLAGLSAKDGKPNNKENIITNEDGFAKIQTPNNTIVTITSEGRKDTITISDNLEAICLVEFDSATRKSDLTRFRLMEDGSRNTYFDEDGDGLPESILTKKADGTFLKQKMEFKISK